MRQTIDNYRIRDLLDFLEDTDRKSIDRLCGIREVDRRLRVAKREALARRYHGNHEQFLRDLRTEDLCALLTDPTEINGGEYHLREASRYNRSALLKIAVLAFRDDVVAPEMEPLSEEGGIGDLRYDPAAAREQAHPYQKKLIADLASAVRAARPGQRLRITVATGGGKTRIANDWISEHALREKRRVLWITKDWTLLQQAAGDMCRRHEGAPKRLGYAGNQAAHQLGQLANRVDRDVVYTTIHTWTRRQDTDFADTEFDAIIIDESHWGEGKGAYGELYKRYRDTTVFIGLTATPRKGTRFRLVGREYDYPTLARMGILAKAIRSTVRTGIAWSPETSTSNGDFDTASLATLARSGSRNTRIVDRYVEGRAEFGKTLMFACDIQHAEALKRMLQQRGVSAEAVHSDLGHEDRRSVIRRFKEGRIRVLVNVAMLTHGVDIRDIETVFLARPTASPTLFAQMVGRAVRKAPGKTHFHLVDFVDNLKVHGDILVSPTSYFGDIGDPRTGAGGYRRGPRRDRHAFEKAPFEHVPPLPGYEEITGLDVQPEQTFGIEFELTRDGFENGDRPRDWMKVATALLESIPSATASKAYAAYHDPSKSHRVWNVEYDRSCGWEVTSPILSGASGYREVVDVCRALEEASSRLGLKVAVSTGTHVHLAWKPRLGALRRLMQLVSHWEPALYSLVAPSRSRSAYCLPVRGQLSQFLALPTLPSWAGHFEVPESRYSTVNASNLFGGGLDTIEIRLHSGTIDARKILGWLSLWMRLLDTAQGRRALPDATHRMRDLPLAEGPQGDITALAEFVVANRELVAHLRERRAAVMERWFADAEHGPRARRVAAKWK